MSNPPGKFLKAVQKIFLLTFCLAAGQAMAATSTFTPSPSPTGTPIDLGTAGTYGVLSSTLTCNGGSSSIAGDAGYTTVSGTHTVSGANFQPAPPQSGLDQATAL